MGRRDTQSREGLGLGGKLAGGYRTQGQTGTHPGVAPGAPHAPLRGMKQRAPQDARTAPLSATNHGAPQGAHTAPHKATNRRAPQNAHTAPRRATNHRAPQDAHTAPHGASNHGTPLGAHTAPHRASNHGVPRGAHPCPQKANWCATGLSPPTQQTQRRPNAATKAQNQSRPRGRGSGRHVRAPEGPCVSSLPAPAGKRFSACPCPSPWEGPRRGRSGRTCSRSRTGNSLPSNKGKGPLAGSRGSPPDLCWSPWRG